MHVNGQDMHFDMLPKKICLNKGRISFSNYLRYGYFLQGEEQLSSSYQF